MDQTHRTPTLDLAPNRVTRLLGTTAAVLITLSVIGQVIKFVTGHDTAKEFIPLFHVGTEGNITTYFSAVVLLLAAALLGWIGRAALRGAQEGGDREARYWLGLSAIFVYLSMDEATALHERLIVPVRDLLEVSGALSFAWVIPASFALLVLTAIYARFILRLPSDTRTLFVLAAALYVGGAIGMELLGGAHYEVYGDQTVVYSALTTVEETMEMAGAIVFVHALLLYVFHHAPSLRIRVTDSG